MSHLGTAYRSAKGIIQAFTSQLGSSFKCMYEDCKICPFTKYKHEKVFFSIARELRVFFFIKKIGKDYNTGRLLINMETIIFGRYGKVISQNLNQIKHFNI